MTPRPACDSWENRVGAALRGENPMVLARMRSGFAVIGDTQHLPGYCLLLSATPGVNHLSDLPRAQRAEFLLDMALIGEAVQECCTADGLRRVNYEVLGNSVEWLHAHIHARYVWEPADRVGWPVWSYPEAERADPSYAYDEARHGQLRARLTAVIERLAAAAYG